MNWIELTNEQQLSEINEASKLAPVVIFKHSTRCSISSMAKLRLEREKAPEGLQFYYLDLLKYRPISNKIATDYHVPHESPQLLLINHTECVYEETHNGIDMHELTDQLKKVH